MAEQPNQEKTEQIAAALEAGRKIEAIKLYRDATGKDLKAAKKFIDALTQQLIERDPVRYSNLTAQSRATGCASVWIVGIGLTAMLLYSLS